MIKKISRNDLRKQRHERSRGRVSGTSEKPRLSVFRSLKHIYVQAVDDSAGKSVCSVSTIEPEIAKELKGKTKSETAKIIGKNLAVRLIANGVKKVVFDRSGYLYHGRVKSLSEGARENGLDF